MNTEKGNVDIIGLLFVIGMLVVFAMVACGYSSYIHEITSPFAKLYSALGQ